MTTQKEKNVHETSGLLARFIGASEAKWWQALGPFLFIGLFSYAFQSLVFGLAMTISMLLHELGHAYFFGRYTIVWKILWLFPLGAVALAASKEENAKSDLISWWRLTWLMMAGPAVNVGLMFLGVTLLGSTALAEFGQALITTNGYLLALNLIPWGALDAGQHFKLVFSSLTVNEERKLLAVIGIMTILFWITLFSLGHVHPLLLILNNFGWILSSVIILVMATFSSFKDDEAHAESELAMTGWQATVATVFYFCLVLATLLLWAGLPVLG